MLHGFLRWADHGAPLRALIRDRPGRLDAMRLAGVVVLLSTACAGRAPARTPHKADVSPPVRAEVASTNGAGDRPGGGTELENCLAAPAPTVRSRRNNPFEEHRAASKSLVRDLAAHCTAPEGPRWVECVSTALDVWDQAPRAEYERLLRRRAPFSSAPHEECPTPRSFADLETTCLNEGRAVCLSRLEEIVRQMECAVGLFEWVNAQDDARARDEECRKRFPREHHAR
jgi:hypothetical protein